MKAFNIYCEGVLLNSESIPATLLGTGFGRTFEEAVLEYFSRNPSEWFDPKRLTFWGCGLYDSFAEAQRLCG